MLKQLANEPSVGLYFVQQHVHKAVPVMVSLKKQIVENTQEAEYVTQDVKDALNSVKSMKEVGPVVIGRMTKIIDSALPRLPSLRRSKRDVVSINDGLSRTGESKGSLLIQPPDKEDSSPRIPEFSSVEQSSAGPTLSSSSSVDYGHTLEPALLSGPSSSGVDSLQREISQQSQGDYTGYVKTIFDSPFFQKASVVVNVSKWNSYGKANKAESVSAGVGGDLPQNSEQEADTEGSTSRYIPNFLGTAYSRASSLGKMVTAPSAVISSNIEQSSLTKDKQEAQEVLAPSLDRTSSTPPLREVSDYSKPGQYVRSFLGSAMQTAESATREGSKFLYGDGEKSVSTVDNPVEGWRWLQAPGKALRTFTKKPEKQPHTEKNLTVKTEGSGDVMLLDPVTSDSESKEETQRLLDMERDGYELFAAERAAKLEEWLGSSEGDSGKETG